MVLAIMVLKWHFQKRREIAAIITLVLARQGKMKYCSLEFPIFSWQGLKQASMNRKFVGSVALQPMSHNDRLFGTIHQGCQWFQLRLSQHPNKTRKALGKMLLACQKRYFFSFVFFLARTRLLQYLGLVCDWLVRECLHMVSPSSTTPPSSLITFKIDWLELSVIQIEFISGERLVRTQHRGKHLPNQ